MKNWPPNNQQPTNQATQNWKRIINSKQVLSKVMKAALIFWMSVPATYVTNPREH